MTGSLRIGGPFVIDPRIAFNAGLHALDHGGETQALAKVDAALKHHPEHAGLWQVKGLLHRALDSMSVAHEALARAATLAPRDARIALGHAHTAFDAGLPAITLFERAASLSQDRRSVLPGLAAAILSEQGCVAASALVAQAVAAAPDWLEGHWLLARLRWMAGDRDGSTASIEQAIAQVPHEPDRWRQLIFILMHSGRHDDALSAIAVARRSAGDHVTFDIAEAACLTETWQIDDADRAFARLGPSDEAAIAIPALRHALRAGRPEQAAARGALLDRADGFLFAPYLSIAWRLIGDKRGQWLDDARLIGCYDIGDALPSFDRLRMKVRALHEGGGQPLEQSVRNGSQTDAPFLSNIDPDIVALRGILVTAIEQHVAQLPERVSGHPLLAPPRDRPVRFAGSWSVRLGGSGFHTNHVHPNGWMSSAFYVGVPERERDEAPQAGWLALAQPPVELGLDLSPIRVIEPRPGRLVLFPSTMWHGTLPFAAGERLTIAFDVARPRS